MSNEINKNAKVLIISWSTVLTSKYQKDHFNNYQIIDEIAKDFKK